MHSNNTQQEHSYHGFIQDFSSLSKKIKADTNLSFLLHFLEVKDESIYNAVVGFYTVKSLIEYGASGNKSANRNKEVYEVLQNELYKMKKAEQQLEDKAKQNLESEVKKKLEDHIDGGVKDVSIYGNHASITLEDNKKEFKISEFLNSDFYEKNGILGFSTLHSDGKSGMHGFVHNKIRHYVVTDGSYEMTLNWYVNGEKCTITININANGSVERIGGHGVSEGQLQANKDVKIGNLYLYEVLAKGRWKEANEPSFEAATKRGVEEPIQENKAANTTQEAGSQTPPPPPPRISSLNKDISDKKRDLDHQNDEQRNEQEKLTPKVQQQEKGGDLFQDIRNFKKNNLQHVDGRKTLIEKSDKNDSSIDIKTNDSGYSSPITDQSQFQVDPKSLTRKLEALNHKEEDKLSGEYGKNSKDHDTEKNIPKDPLSENILQKIKEDKPIYKWLKDKIEGKEGNQNLDALEEKLSQKSNVPKDSSSENVLQEIKEDKPIYKWLKDKIEGKEDNQNLDALEEKLSQKSNVPKDPLSENILQKIKEDKPIHKWLKDKIEGKEGNQNSDTIEEKLSQKSGQGNIVEKRENDGGKPLSTDGNEEVWYDALEDLTGLDEDEYFDAVEDLNEQKINQSTNLADQVIDKQEVEHNSDRSTSPVSVDENTNVEQSSDTQQESSHRSDVNNKLESAQPTNPADRVMDELREVLKKPDKGLKKPAQQVTEKNIPKDPFSENILQKIKEDKPIYKWLKDKIEGKEDNHNLDALEKTLSQKNGQDNTVEENDSNRPISPVSVDGNANVEQSKDTQSQKSSRSNGQEPEEEERNFQKTSEALVSWKEKRLNNYRKINEDIKEISFNAQEKAQSNHTNNLTPFENLLKEIREKSKQDNRGLKKVDFTNKPLQNKDESELQEKFSQEKRGLKPANQKEMSEQTREHLLKDGLLKDDSTDVKKVAERESAGTNQVIDKNSDLSKILEKDEEQLKVGVIEEEREDTLAEHINSHDRNRIALSNKNRLLWTKHVKQQQENKDKGISI
ncbi:MAG: hypothetical protein ACR5K9_03340 [Wolbachia sp.]